MGKKRQTHAKDTEHEEVDETHVVEGAAPTAAGAAEPTTPREQSTTAVAPTIEGGERASNASETPREDTLPATPVKNAKSSERVAYTVDELALERNKLFQLVVFVATLAVSALLFVYQHALVKPKVDAAVKRGTDFARQVDAKYSVSLRASDLYNVALEELEEYAAWRQIVEPRLRQAVAIVGHAQSRVARYFQ